MSIRAVIFDADGVLVFPGDQAGPLVRDMSAGFHQHRFDDCLVGKADIKDALPEYFAKWGWPGTADDFLALWLDMGCAADARMMNAVSALRNQGCFCCLATNQEKHRAEYMRTAMGFAAKFDALFFSCEMGVRKPAPEFYAQIEEALGLSGDEIAFWDDSQSHMDAAKRRGWQAKRFTGYGDFSKKMQAIMGSENKQ